MNSKRIVEKIEKQIASGLLPPGSRLSSERVIAKQFACSRQAVREALAELRTRGVIETRHGQGSTVAGLINADNSRGAIEEFYTAYPRLLYDILDIREVLESKAAFLTAQRASLKDRYRIEQAYLAMLRASSASGSPDELAHADFGFHSTIAEASQSPVLAHTLDSLSRLFAKSVRASVDNLYGRSFEHNQINEQHREIIEAILARDPEAAEAAARRHIVGVRSSLQALEEANQELVRS